MCIHVTFTSSIYFIFFIYSSYQQFFINNPLGFQITSLYIFLCLKKKSQPNRLHSISKPEAMCFFLSYSMKSRKEIRKQLSGAPNTDMSPKKWRKEQSRFNEITYKQFLFLMKNKFRTSERVTSTRRCKENQKKMLLLSYSARQLDFLL